MNYNNLKMWRLHEIKNYRGLKCRISPKKSELVL